jgi:hypothetical protein
MRRALAVMGAVVALAVAGAAPAQPAMDGVGGRRPVAPEADPQLRALWTCMATKVTESPSGPAVYAEMRRQSRVLHEPAPDLTERDVTAWLHRVMLLQCLRELGLSADGR